MVAKKGGFTIIRNKKNELIPTRTVTGWRVCIDYKKLNTATGKDHYPLPFIDQMFNKLDTLTYVFLFDILVIIKFPLPLRTRRRLLLRVLMVPLILEGCHLDYIMHLPPSKGV